MENKLSLSIRPELSCLKIKRIIVKFGSQVITKDQGGIDEEKLSNIVKDVVFLRETGLQIILVSSGAIHTGKIFLEKKSQNIDYLQAASAIGQPHLMKAYIEEFQKHKKHCAQVLITHDDVKNRTRFLNVQKTLERLLQENIIPIFNENDTVSFEEISLGDNDQLAVMVTQMLGADTLCLLTGSDGLYQEDPAKNKDSPPTHFKTVSYDKSFHQIKLISKSPQGRGGMMTKLMAVRKLTPLGIGVVMASYKYPSPLVRALTESCGTYFEGAPLKPSSQRKSWLLAIVKNHCGLIVDEGAYTAICEGKSLLPSGIKSFEGRFLRGDCLPLIYKNRIFAVGLAEYNSLQLKKIIGKKSNEIYFILGQMISSEVIHRNNLSLVSKKEVGAS